MKKKFYSGMLMVAMLFATVGSFVSCKDYDEDMYAQLQGENQTLQELIDQQREELETRIGDLEEAQKLCAENCSIFKAQMEAWKLWAEANYVTKEEYNNKVLELTKLISDNTTKIQNLETLINQIKNELLEADKALEQKLMNELLKVQNNLTTLITNVQNELNELKKTVQANSEALKKAQDDILKLQGDVTGLQGDLKKLEERVKANEDAIVKINNTLTELENRLKALEDLNLPEAVKKAHEAWNLAKTDSARIDALEAELAKLKSCNCDNSELIADIDSICGELDDIKEDIKKVREEAAENLKKANEYTDQRIQEAVSALEGRIDTKLSALETAYKEADEKLQEQLDALAKRVDELEPRVKANEENIDELFGLYDDVKNALSQFITGVLLQGTENPVFGSFSLPANIQSNVLMAYYGTTGSHTVYFPDFYPRNYVTDKEALSEKDIQMLGITRQIVAQDGETIVGSAGKVYVTVNPSNVNFEGETLAIVNSIEEESGIKLSPLTYSDKKLTFGYSRSAENGLYEAEATLAPEDVHKVNMKFDFDASDIKATIKDVLNPRDGINVTNVANTVYDVMSQFNQKLDANALKATWTDSLGVTRNTYSQYNLAATAVKPLSYAFMKDVNVKSLPGIEKAENFINKVADKVKVRLPDFNVNLEVPTIKKIEIADLSDDLIGEFRFLVEMDTTIYVPVDTIDNIYAVDQYGNKIKVDPIVVGGQAVYIYLNYPIDMTDQVKHLYDEFEAPVKDVNKILEDLEVFMDDVNALLDEINKLNNFMANVETGIDRVKDKLISYLNKFNNKMCNLINQANTVLQPRLFVSANGEFVKLSQSKSYPSKINSGSFTLVPTSYTAEIVAPAYKKLVGVTNVYSMDRKKSAQDGDASCMSALTKANATSGVAEVLEGDVLSVDFKAESGYIYEIVYTAVDYSGKIAAKKYYVAVK